jgi:hypothetical protein
MNFCGTDFTHHRSRFNPPNYGPIAVDVKTSQGNLAARCGVLFDEQLSKKEVFMHHWRLFGQITLAGLLLAGCTVYGDNETASVQAAAPPVAAQSAAATATPKVSSIVSTASIVASNAPAETCAVTRPPQPPFIPPTPYPWNPPSAGEFWYGTDALWTTLPESGVWAELPHNLEGYTQKLFWWRKGYFWRDEPEPELTVTGQGLDATAPAPRVSAATNAFADDIGSAILVGVDFPTLGCWQISGQYAKAELSFVIWLAP